MSKKPEPVENRVASSETTHEPEVALTHDLPPRDVVKTLKEFLDRQQGDSDLDVPRSAGASRGRS